MTQQINVGSPNNGTGDAIRTAFGKVNSNTTELSLAISAKANQADLNIKANQADLNSLATSTATAIGGKLDKTGDASGTSVVPTGEAAQSLAAALSASSILGKPAVLDGTSLSAQLRSRFQDPIDLYGYVNAGFDGASTPVDNHDVLSTVLTSAGRKCLMPVGRAYIGSALPTISAKTVSLWGHSRAETLVFENGVPGLVINQLDYSYRTDIQNVTFETLGNETGGTALSVSYSDADATLNTDQTRLTLKGLTFGGFYNKAQGWLIGIDTLNINSGQIHDIYGYGRVNNSASTPTSKYCNMQRLIRLRCGNTYGLGLMNLRNINCINADAMLELAGARSYEGVQLFEFNAVSTRVGVLSTLGAISPGTVIKGGHLNVLERGVLGPNLSQAIIKDVLIYKHPEAVSETVCVELSSANQFDIDFIAENACSDAAQAFVGLRLTDSSYGRARLRMDRGSNAADLKGASGLNEITATMDSSVTSSPALFTSTSSGANYVRRGPFYAAAKNVSAVSTNSAAPVFSQTPSMPVLKGERYRLTASISHTMGSTASSVSLDVIQASGTATVTLDFDAGGTSSSIGRNVSQAANANDYFTVSGVATVTASGTLAFGIRGYIPTAGAAGTIAAGGAQLVVEAA
jgi:hypothetical protein